MSFNQLVMQSKENSLSFSNITRKQMRQPPCEHHNDKVAKFRGKESHRHYCYSCAIRQASRGEIIQEVQPQSTESFQQIKYHGKSTQPHLIQDTPSQYHSNQYLQYDKKALQQQRYRQYQQSQKDIKANINEYNTIFHQINELLADIQIKDIMFFNKQLQQTEKMYQTGRMISPGCSPAQSAHLTEGDSKKSKEIIRKMKKLYHIIQETLSQSEIQPADSFQDKEKNIAKQVGWIGNHRSISPSQLKKYANQNTNPQLYPSNTSSINNPIDNQRYSFNSQTMKRQPLIKAKSFKNGSGSINSNCSIPQSSNASINPSSGKGSSGRGSQNDSKNNKKQLQDTPQSIKSKISGQNLVVPSQIAVQMFEKISICESIDLSCPPNQEPSTLPKPDPSKVTNWMMESTGSIQAEAVQQPSRSSVQGKKSRYDKQNNPDTQR